MKHPRFLAFPLALPLALLAPSALAQTASDADVKAMQKRIDSLETQLEAMRKLLESRLPAPASAPAAAPAAAAGAASWGDKPAAPAQLSQSELDDMKRKVARQEMRVNKLYADTYDSPGSGLQITGYIDPTYVVNNDLKTASFQFLNRDPYTYDNSTNGDIYLRIFKRFGEGPMAPNIDIQIQPARGSGTFDTASDGSVVASIFQQALMNVPLTDTLSAIAGYTISYAGYEYVESTMTNTVSHNLLYDFTAPANYVGVGLGYIEGPWAIKGFLGNEEYYNIGSRADVHSNRTPTLMVRADYTYNSALYLGGSFNVGRSTLYGPIEGCETGFGYQCTSNSAYGGKFQMELDMTYLAADVQYNAQIDYGQQKKSAWNGGTATWWGFSALAHRKWSTASLGRMGATVRLDYLNNEKNGGGGSGWYLSNEVAPGTDAYNGFGIDPNCWVNDVDTDGNSNNGVNCKGANRWALTTAVLFYPTDQWTLKAEYRYDRANLPVFATRDGPYRKDNNVFSLQTVYAF